MIEIKKMNERYETPVVTEQPVELEQGIAATSVTVTVDTDSSVQDEEVWKETDNSDYEIFI